MKNRKLRIAFSAVCGVVFLLMIVLWVRSYWRWEHVGLGARRGEGFLIVSANGSQSFHYDNDSGTAWRRSKLHVRSLPVPDSMDRGTLIKRFYWDASISNIVLSVPYWFLVALAIALAVAPWTKMRFSLRILFLATTLIALILGRIIFTSR